MERTLLRTIIRQAIIGKLKNNALNKFKEFRVLNNVPELIPILVDLLSTEFTTFVEDIEWIAPKPTTFRVMMKNGQFFYLYDTGRSWVAEIAGKKYYLLNVGEEQAAINALARLLRTSPIGYGEPGENIDDIGGEGSSNSFDSGGNTGGGDFPGREEEPTTITGDPELDQAFTDAEADETPNETPDL